MHGNPAPHLHCHLFPGCLDDYSSGVPVNYRITEASLYQGDEESLRFVDQIRKALEPE